ncbi:MAG TPA: PKD domain-containing protein [Pyrinomonadaceae bacterium]|jgi:PKD repeat protein
MPSKLPKAKKTLRLIGLSGIRTRIIFASVLCVVAALAAGLSGSASSPGSGVLSAATPSLSFTGGPYLAANPTSNVPTNTGPVCDNVTPCDDYGLTVDVPAGYDTTHNIRLTVAWAQSKADYDIYVLKADNTAVTDSATSADPEVATFPAIAGQYKLRIVPFAPLGQTYNATVELVEKPSQPAPTAPGPSTPRFQNYTPPRSSGMGTDAGEPSIGVNWQTGRAIFLAGSEALRVTFDDCASPAKALWEDKSPPFVTSLDPILFTDRNRTTNAGRTFVSQLTGQDSITFFTDDDGESWLPSQGGGIPSGVDHQTIGGGPFNESASPAPPPHPLYPNAIYYCSQESVTAFCARSDDGGLTFGPGVPIYTTECSAIHGHAKVANDGTVYVANKNCGGKAGVAVSTDNGVTWGIRTAPNSSTTGFLVDASVGIGANGTIYLGYQAADGNPHVAVSHNRGDSWVSDQDVGVSFGLKNSTFPTVVAGDDDRAAYAFLGTTVEGNYTEPAEYPADAPWHLYIATTFDGGQNWTTVDATPNDPVQRGTICNLGTVPCKAHSDAGIPDRNLLDFMDAVVDAQGRVLVGYPDGCIDGCVSGTKNSYSAFTTIARQAGGKRLFAQFDPNPAEPVGPAAPSVTSVSRDSAGIVHLSWAEPDNGGSAITGYRIYRRTQPGTYGAPLATITADKTTYDDATATAANTAYFYKVTAINAQGEGLNCGEFPVGSSEDPCSGTGTRILSDPTGDSLDTLAGHDVQSLSIAEPYGIGAGKMVFTLKVADLSIVPANSIWPVEFKAPNGSIYVVQMTSTTGASDVAFKYGKKGTTLLTADPLSGFSANGTITIVVPTSGIGNPSVGQRLEQFLTRVAVNGVAVTLTPDNMPDGLVGLGQYTVRGNEACRPNTAPTAALSANPTSGSEGLVVNFDGSGSSDPDTAAPADTIASYTFNFGDGTAAVTQPSPTVSHTYSTAGSYRATLQVTDSRGKASSNTVSVVIEVTKRRGKKK